MRAVGRGGKQRVVCWLMSHGVTREPIGGMRTTDLATGPYACERSGYSYGHVQV